jgi:type IV secretory pathway VirJ component
MGVLWLAACSPEPRRESLDHGRFQRLQLSVPRAPRSVVLLLAEPALQPLADRLLATVASEDSIVTRIDAVAFQRLLDATPSGCVFPSGDLDNLAHFIQAYLNLPSYQPAIVVGLGAGAGIAAVALRQAPPGTFAGGLVVDDCASTALHALPCARDVQYLASSASPAVLAPPADPLIHLRSSEQESACPPPSPSPAAPARELGSFATEFAALAATARARAVSSPTDLNDLPIVEVLAKAGDAGDTFGVLLSGDGGWAGIDKELSARLAEQGLPIVGVDSLRYFWRARTPESTTADLERVINRYQLVWKRPRVLLLGYSQGADVLPFILNRLSAKTRSSVVSAVALSLSTTATFEFHVSNWVGASGDRPTLPEVQRLDTRLVCVYGKQDPDALCPQLDPSLHPAIELPGDHHFNGDYPRLARLVLDELKQ